MAKVKSKKFIPKKYLLTISVLAVFLFSIPFIVYLTKQPQGYQQDANAQTAATAVSIIDFEFSPATVTVPVGGTVTWTNMSASGSDHTTTSDTGVWDSGLTNPTGAGGLIESYSHTFTAAGTFTYHCNVHTFMHGTVIVTAAAAAPTAPPAPTATPATIVPSPNCLGSCPQPTSAVAPTSSVIIPTPAVGTTPAPGSGTGGSDQSLLQLLLSFIELILQFFQSLFGGGGHSS